MTVPVTGGAGYMKSPGSGAGGSLRVSPPAGELRLMRMTCRRDADLRIRATLDWTPQYDDLETIAAHALAWEQKLREREGELPHVVSA
jgi:hypothetical protein